MQNDSESESDRESEEDELRFGVMFFKASRMQAVQKALRGGTSMRTKVEFVKHIYKKASKTPEGLKPALLAAFRAAFHSELPELRQVKSKLAKRAELYEEMLRGFESTALYFVPDLDPRFLLDPQSPHTRSAGKQRVAKKESKKKAAPAYEDFRPSDRVRFVDAAVHAQRGQGEVISIGYNLTFLNVRLDGTGKSMPVSRAEITKCTDTIATRRREKGNKHVSDANGTALEIGMAVTCVGLYVALSTSGGRTFYRHCHTTFAHAPLDSLSRLSLARSQVPQAHRAWAQRRPAAPERARLYRGAAREHFLLRCKGTRH